MQLQEDLSILRRRMERLSKQLIPKDLNQTKYPASVYEDTASFVVFAHAEIEHFMERRCLEVAKASVERWQTDGKPRRTVLNLVAFCYSAEYKSAKPRNGDVASAIARAVAMAFERFESIVEENNGIKEHNLTRLLLPVGLPDDQLSAVLVGQLSNLGSWRDDQARKSIGARKQIDPRDAKNLVEDIMNELAVLDADLHELGNE